MGFNLLVRLILRLGGFIFGIAGGTLLVGLLDELFRFSWLPLAMGLAVQIVVSFQSWMRATKLGGAFCASITSGVTLTFCLSAPLVITRMGALAPQVVKVALLATFLVSTALFIVRGLLPRKTSAMAGWLLIPIGAALVLGVVSGGIGGGDHMVAWAMRVLHMAHDQAETAVHLFRKTIHVSAYGALGLALFRGASAGRAAKPQAIMFALLMVLSFASFDELRQTTAPNRTGSAWDVALDMSGALLFVLIAAARIRSQGPNGNRSGRARKTPNPAKNAL